ncbi:MAG: type VI secretion system baseplate subunit TssF [Bacteroidetes Order II. Incertae sedis bacterium]|nr:type VI secretion system baseplate subunit TssF [Bacteroidetes Order II. bacterium]
MSRKYYEEEMRYLHEAGKAFAQAHPETARFLNLDSITDRDPYVERLFEGFAFLSGRIHERLDDDLPEYTEGLFNLMWPHYLRPIPGLSILEMRPKIGVIQETTSYAAGTEVISKPVGPENVACRFTTTNALDVHPLTLSKAEMTWIPGSSSLNLRFDLLKGASFENLRFKNGKLRLFFYADPAIASTLHLFMTRHVRRVTLFCGPEDQPFTIANNQSWVEPCGFMEEDGLLPYSRFSFKGFRLLQEYFSFRPKFWFVDLCGFDRFTPEEPPTFFEVRVDFDRSFPEDRRFKTDNIRLHCTPIINLFPKDTTPIRVDHLTTEYRINPDTNAPRSFELYDTTEVVGIEERTNRRHYYKPFYSFERDEKGRFYTTKIRQAPSGQYDMYLSILGSNLDQDLANETLSITALATNRSLPREHLKEGDISKPPPGFADVVQLRNLTQPTLDRHPPRDQNFFWKLISHLSMNHMSIANPISFRLLLSLYDWERSEANRKRIEGIRSIIWRPKERVYRGAIIRGSEVVLEVQDGAFADEGDLCLFGLVMSHFLGMYATINSFVYLTLVSMPSGKTYEWAPQKGVKPVL